VPDDQNPESSKQVPTNLRLVLLVESIAQAGVPVGPAAIGKSLGLPKPTVHRLLQTAEAEGLVLRHVDGRSYGPGPRLRRLAANTLSSERMRTERLAILSQLAERVGETCNISLPERDGMVYLERVETHWPLRIQLPIGTQVPLNCTASGKMYLSSLRSDKLVRLLQVMSLSARTSRSIVDRDDLKAELALTRRRGYATDNEEFMDGMAAIAVPVCDDKSRLLSTLSIHAPVQRRDQQALIGFLDVLREAATRLEELVQD